MYTEWGFKDAECPVCAEFRQWDLDSENLNERLNEQVTYWLVSPRYKELG